MPSPVPMQQAPIPAAIAAALNDARQSNLKIAAKSRELRELVAQLGQAQPWEKMRLAPLATATVLELHQHQEERAAAMLNALERLAIAAGRV